MKSIIFISLLATAQILVSSEVFAQTLYTPGGTVGNNTTNSNVGIGTGAIPLTKLHVSGGDVTIDPSSGNAIIFTGTASSEQNRYLSLVNSINYQSASGLKAGGVLVSDAFSFANPGKNDLVVKGKIGIGVNPQYKLDIQDALAGASMQLRFWNNTTNTAGTETRIDLPVFNGASGLSIRSMGSSAAGGFNVGTYDGWMHTGQAGSYLHLSGGDGQSKHVTIKNDGNVGIGTQTPGGKLDINAGSAYAIRTSTSSRYVIEVKNTGDVDGGWWLVNDANGNFVLHENAVADQFTIKPGGYFGMGTSSPSSKLHLLQSSNSDWAMHIQNTAGSGKGLRIQSAASDATPVLQVEDNNGNNRFLVRSDGNVGIGTTNPGTFKLAVEGKIGAREVNVTLTNPWPDYVFEPNYKLQTLPELEQYIKTNKHLPEVPSAEQVKENGLSVGEMNAILLKKVEELTLHLIEKNKQLEKLENRIEQLENKK